MSFRSILCQTNHCIMKHLFVRIVGITVLLGSIGPGVAFAQTITNPFIPSSVCYSIDSNLSIGTRDRMTNGSVINLQAFLHGRGYLKAEPTGYFGVLTMQAVKDFQRQTGLPVTGFFGPLSRERMKLITCDLNDPAPQQLSISVRTDKDSYTQDEPVNIFITAQNNTNIDRTLSWNSGCQTSYMIDDYDSGKNTMCTMSLTSVVIPAHGIKTWTMTNTPANYRIPVGVHSVHGAVLNYGSSLTNIRVVASEGDKFKLTSPNVGQIWKLGEKKDITWSPFISGETVDVQLLPHTNCAKDPCPLMLIKPYDLGLKVPADRVFSWTVGNNVESRDIPAGAYDVMVCLNGKPRICDTSDAQIVIEASAQTSSLRVLNPNGGETVKLGSTYSIQWTDGGTQYMAPNAGLRAPAPVDMYLRSYIVCITTPCEGQRFTIAKNYSGFNYVWTVGTVIEKILADAGNYQVQVCLAGTNTCDTSDGYFTVSVTQSE
jgi:hypothetical protein